MDRKRDGSYTLPHFWFRNLKKQNAGHWFLTEWKSVKAMFIEFNSIKASVPKACPLPHQAWYKCQRFRIQNVKSGTSVASNTRRSHYIKMHYLFKFYHIPLAAKRSHRRNFKQPSPPQNNKSIPAFSRSVIWKELQCPLFPEAWVATWHVGGWRVAGGG
jgi:hypothetical protein